MERNARCVFPQFGFVHQYKTLSVDANDHCRTGMLAYCGRGMTGDNQQSRNGQYQDILFSMKSV